MIAQRYRRINYWWAIDRFAWLTEPETVKNTETKKTVKMNDKAETNMRQKFVAVAKKHEA